MTIQELAILYKKELTGAGIGASVIILLALVCFYLPAPKLIDPPTSTKEATITLRGTAAPKVGIIAFDKSGNAIIVVNSDEKGEFTLASLPVGEGETTFRLRAAVSGWRFSLPRTVVIKKDSSAPALEVQSLQGAVVTGSSTVVTGKAEPGSTVTVNGVNTTVSADGTWSATVALQSGKNTVTVTATDSAGNATTQTQTITYTPTAADAPTGTATVTASTTSLSPGSLPPSVATAPTTSDMPIPAGPVTLLPTSSPTPAPTPVLQPILAITSSASVSNGTPNSRANETIYVNVKDNYGRPVTDASVIANVYFKTGMANFSLKHVGNGTYSASFKLNDKYVSGYRVNVESIARWNGFTSTANTSFVPQ